MFDSDSEACVLLLGAVREGSQLTPSNLERGAMEKQRRISFGGIPHSRVLLRHKKGRTGGVEKLANASRIANRQAAHRTEDTKVLPKAIAPVTDVAVLACLAQGQEGVLAVEVAEFVRLDFGRLCKRGAMGNKLHIGTSIYFLCPLDFDYPFEA